MDAIPCDESEASFRMAAVVTGVDEATATRVVSAGESLRLGQRLLLMFAGPRAGPGDAMCVETLRAAGAAPG